MFFPMALAALLTNLSSLRPNKNLHLFIQVELTGLSTPYIMLSMLDWSTTTRPTLLTSSQLAYSELGKSALSFCETFQICKKRLNIMLKPKGFFCLV